MASSCKTVGIFILVISTIDSAVLAQQQRQRTPTASGPGVVLQLKDAGGHPVSGAVAALEAKWEDRATIHLGREKQHPETFVAETHGHAAGPVASDSRGQLIVPATMLKPVGRTKTSVPVYILNPERRLGAIVDLSADDANGKPQAVTLEALCRVTGKVASPEMEELGHKVNGLRVEVPVERAGRAVASSESAQPRFAVLLPPGKFTLRLSPEPAADGATFEGEMKEIEVPKGKADLELETIALGVSELTKHLGKPAPELKIKEWRNGSPVTMAELRGRVVILDVWNYGCGPCIAEMPILFKLQGQHAEKDLTIIAIHDRSGQTLAEAYQRSETARQKAFGGREFPYRSTIDVMARGTLEAYGVEMWPTVLVIDREGKLARIFHRIDSPEFLTAVEGLIKSSPRARG